MNSNKWAKDLTGKDREKAKIAAEYIFNTPDPEAWQWLIENGDYLFNYIREKAGKNLIKAANKDNLEKIFSLLKYHSSGWDEYIAEALAKFSSDELNIRLHGLLATGSSEEKAYAAKYFSVVEYHEAADALFEAARQDYKPLKDNVAQALGKLNHRDSYNYFIEKLKSGDDWGKIEAASFLAYFGNKEAAPCILEAMSNSGMAEHIAGEAATLVDIYEFFQDKNEHLQTLALEAFDNILSGISEIWPLSVLQDFKVYECLDKLIELSKNKAESVFAGRYAQLLLKAKSKITLISENSEYTFDEDRVILSELEEIYHLLLSQSNDFWQQQAENLYKELKAEDKKRKLSAIQVIKDFELSDSLPYLLELVSNQDESEGIICEAILALKKFNKISLIDNKDSLISSINDPNLIAIVKNSLSN